jgi:hypothetical protein
VFEGLLYGMRIKRLQRQKRRVRASYGAGQKQLKKDSDEYLELVHQEMFETSLLDEDIAFLQHGRLIEQAETYLIDVPALYYAGNLPQNWMESNVYPGKWRLNQERTAELRALIREEQTAEWERWSRWVPLLSGLTGLFGTAIGLIVAISKWF